MVDVGDDRDVADLQGARFPDGGWNRGAQYRRVVGKRQGAGSHKPGYAVRGCYRCGAPLRAASNRVPRTAHSVTRRIPFNLNRDVPDPHAAHTTLHGLEHQLVATGVPYLAEH